MFAAGSPKHAALAQQKGSPQSMPVRLLTTTHVPTSLKLLACASQLAVLASAPQVLVCTCGSGCWDIWHRVYPGSYPAFSAPLSNCVCVATGAAARAAAGAGINHLKGRRRGDSDSMSMCACMLGCVCACVCARLLRYGCGFMC